MKYLSNSIAWEILSTRIKIINVQRLAKSRHLLQLAIMGSSVNADYNI